ncbi:MAG: GntR family transcriptional regulator [Planctomycetaceae bacterium]|nr:GntR family transcriptional regulator [Planctomycetaceae bacterium]
MTSSPVLSASTDKKAHAYEIIKNKIIEGELAPLMDISEDELQHELGVSRTPIREALQHLQKEGFVYIYPRKGTIVAEVTEDLIKEIFHMRVLNEAYIVKQACNFMPLEWLEEKKRQFLNPPDLPPAEQRRHLMLLDRDLHFGYLKYCNNRFLQNIMSVVYDHNHRIRLIVSDPRPREGDNSVEEHVGTIEASIKKDYDAIDAIVAMHVKRSCSISVRYFRR